MIYMANDITFLLIFIFYLKKKNPNHIIEKEKRYGGLSMFTNKKTTVVNNTYKTNFTLA